MNKESRLNHTLIAVQCAEVIHCVSPGGQYAQFTGVDEMYHYAHSHDCKSVVVLRNHDVHSIKLNLSDTAPEAEREQALLYEASSMLNVESATLTYAAFFRNALPGVMHDYWVSTFSKTDLNTLNAECRAHRLHLHGLCALQLAILYYHFTNENTRKTTLLLMLDESTFMAFDNGSGITLRNIALGTQGMAVNEEQWGLRAQRRLQALEGQNVTLYIEKWDEVFYQKMQKVIAFDKLSMLSFDTILPFIHPMLSLPGFHCTTPSAPARDYSSLLNIFYFLILLGGGVAAYACSLQLTAQIEENKALAAKNTAQLAALTQAQTQLKTAQETLAKRTKTLAFLDNNTHIDKDYMTVFNLLSNYNPRYTRIDALTFENNVMTLRGESKHQKDLTLFTAHVEQRLRENNLVLQSKSNVKNDAGVWNFTFTIGKGGAQ